MARISSLDQSDAGSDRVEGFAAMGAPLTWFGDGVNSGIVMRYIQEKGRVGVEQFKLFALLETPQIVAVE